MLTPAEMDRKLDEHFGFEARDDVEGVLATLAPDAVHDVVGWPSGPSYGRAEARAFYQRPFADLSESRVDSLRRLYGENFLVDESLWHGVAQGKPFGLEGHGGPLEFRLFHIIEFTHAGDIGHEKVWIDLAAIMRQLPQK